MTVYVVVSVPNHTFCNVYATRELAERAIAQCGGNARFFTIFEETVLESL